MGKKICPLKFNANTLDRDGMEKDENACVCIENECAFWVSLWTTEGHGYHENGCAIALLAMKNADGKVVV